VLDLFRFLPAHGAFSWRHRLHANVQFIGHPTRTNVKKGELFGWVSIVNGMRDPTHGSRIASRAPEKNRSETILADFIVSENRTLGGDSFTS
jgi:hypothetical protein